MLKNTIILLMGIAGSGKMTISNAIKKQDNNFKLTSSDSWSDPILKLLGDDEAIWWALDEKGWNAINQARDVILNTMADVCPPDSNFVICQEMLANNPYHQDFYNKVISVVEKRNAIFLPVRLICELDELLRRVQHTDRAAYYKTRDVELIKKRFTEDQVFFSDNPNEYTLDVTHLTSEKSATTIIAQMTELTVKIGDTLR